MCKYWWIKTLNSLEKRTTLVTIENIQKLKNNLNPFKNIKKNIFTNGYVKSDSLKKDIEMMLIKL